MKNSRQYLLEMNGFVQMHKCGCLPDEGGICRELLQPGVTGSIRVAAVKGMKVC
jgi:hypothetical protein